MQLSDDIIRSLSTPQSFERGQNLFHAGAVFDLERQDMLLMGRCEGSGAPFYQVVAQLDGNGVKTVNCTCPYDWGGLCKHSIAVLLTYIHEPGMFKKRKTVAELLVALDRNELIGLLESLSERDPDLYEKLELATTFASHNKHNNQGEMKTRISEVTEATYRRQVRQILHSLDRFRPSEAYWMMGGIEPPEKLRECRCAGRGVFT